MSNKLLDIQKSKLTAYPSNFIVEQLPQNVLTVLEDVKQVSLDSYKDISPSVVYNHAYRRAAAHAHGLSREEVDEFLPDIPTEADNFPSFIRIPLPDNLQKTIIKTFSRWKNIKPRQMSIKVQVQLPGMVSLVHFDRLANAVPHNTTPGKHKIPEKRGMVFLSEWEDGHSFTMDGDQVTWETDKMYTFFRSYSPHGGGNYGFSPRILVIFTWFDNDHL